MTTTTSGLAPVATTAELAGAVVESLVRPASRRRPHLARWVVGLDALVAVTVAGAAAIHPSPGGTVRGAILIWWPVAIAVAGGYSRLAADPRRFPARALLAAALGAATAVWSIPALVPGAGTDESPRTLAALALLLAAMVSLGSAAARGLIAMAAPSQSVRTVLVGPSSQVRELLQEAARPAGRRAFEPVAVCLPGPADDRGLEQPAEAWPVPVHIGIEDQLVAAVSNHDARAVVVAPGPHVGYAELRRWGAWLQDIDVDLLVSSGLRDVARGRLAFTTLGGADLVHVRPAPLSGVGLRVKGVVDRVVAAGLLVVLSPLLGLLTLLIRADSPGPAFYRQTRVGRRGRLFTVYKLRTMQTDADHVVEQLAEANESDREGVLFKIKRDPRITKIGSVLRTYSLDELPQLWNVVRGEMSLIGPRPALPSQVQAYHADLVHRLAVKPGMTGLWQVSGRSDLPWDETVRLDLQYVDNWSWWLDLRIAVRTVTAVMGCRGAY
jgi:exopolysaccharide biosynthesis polyprenyl glycosylphosphotransferase